MKTILIVIAVLLTIAGCGTTKPNSAAAVHEQTIGSVQITFDDTGNWIKLVSSGVAPIHDKSSHATSEATKIAAMHAKQNIVEFMSNDIRSDKTVDTTSKSRIHTGAEGQAERSDANMDTLTTVVEHIRDNSAAILRGIYITNQDVSPEFVRVEVTVTKQSIAASQSVRDTMGGSVK